MVLDAPIIGSEPFLEIAPRDLGDRAFFVAPSMIS